MSDSQSPPLGILDWGIGGGFALREVLRVAPDASVIYLSDAGNIPYGLQDRRSLAVSVGRALERLRALGAGPVLVACHSASTALVDIDDVDIHGVIDGSIVPEGARVAVIGGARTVRSRAWRRALQGRTSELRQRIAQPLSAAVEAGRIDRPDTLRQVRAILGPVAHLDHLVLACTHYPALVHLFEQVVPGMQIVDPACRVARRLARPGGGGVIALTTGDPDAVQHVWDRVFPELGQVRFGQSMPTSPSLPASRTMS